MFSKYYSRIMDGTIWKRKSPSPFPPLVFFVQAYFALIFRHVKTQCAVLVIFYADKSDDMTAVRFYSVFSTRQVFFLKNYFRIYSFFGIWVIEKSRYEWESCCCCSCLILLNLKSYHDRSNRLFLMILELIWFEKKTFSLSPSIFACFY